jgi:hypothetical protein
VERELEDLPLRRVGVLELVDHDDRKRERTRSRASGLATSASRSRITRSS